MIDTIREWLESILGTYEPVTYTEKIMQVSPITGESITTSFERVADGLAGLDWSYIFTALLLLVTIYSVFRLLGVLLQSLSGGSRW